jgi:DNA-binding response OmpR family regulator
MLSLPPAVATKSILLVEDDAPSRDLYRSALQRGGHNVVTVEDGLAALQYIGAALPQVIVLDMMLPLLGGRDVLRELRANPETRRIPVVIITGTDVSNLSERAGIPVLQKPFALSVLVDAVDAAVRRASQ